MENKVSVKARFTSSTTKGSTVLQFELDSDCKNDGTAGKLLSMVRHIVTLDITDEQMVLDLEDGTEELDGQTEMFEEEEPEVEEEFAPIVLELPEAVAEDEFEEESDEEE